MTKRKLVLIAVAFAIILVVGLGFTLVTSQPNEEADVETQTYNFLIEKGFNPIQASGILATAKQCSNMNCTAVSVPDGECYGLFQWTYVRLENLKQFAKENDKMVEDLDTQLLFMMEEMDSGSEYYIGDFQYKGYEWNEFWDAQTPNQAGMTFIMVYTRPAINSNRVGDWAEEFYQQYN